MRIIQQLTLEDVPLSFDEKQYAIKKPEALAYQKTFCQRHNIPDRVRLYVHSLTQNHSFNFEEVRSLFLNESYDLCYQALISDLFRVVNHPNYDPLGYFLVESAIKTGRKQELIDRLAPYSKVSTAQKCLNVLLDGSPARLKQPCLVFYAFESSYVEAFKVSIASFILANKPILNCLTLLIGFDPNVDSEEIAEFLADFPVRYRLFPMQQCADLDLKESYGHDPVVKLNKSAYYRIFLLKQIVQEYKNTHHKALYLDADTLTLTSLEDLFLTEMQKPLQATNEEQNNQLVMKAKALNFLTDYFNSGVLLFDLQHPLLPQLVDKTIQVATTQQHRLVLQDQCALNIGFEDHVDLLPDQYNYMLHSNPYTVSCKQVSIMHFTGRVKPWQRAYQDKTIFGEMWKSFHRLVNS